MVARHEAAEVGDAGCAVGGAHEQVQVLGVAERRVEPADGGQQRLAEHADVHVREVSGGHQAFLARDAGQRIERGAARGRERVQPGQPDRVLERPVRDGLLVAEQQFEGRVGAERGGRGREEVGRAPLVVVVAERHEVAARGGDAGATRVRRAAAVRPGRLQREIAGVGHVLEQPGVALGLLRCGPVVDDDQFDVGVRLCRDAGDGALQEAGAVACGDDDGDAHGKGWIRYRVDEGGDDIRIAASEPDGQSPAPAVIRLESMVRAARRRRAPGHPRASAPAGRCARSHAAPR